MYCSSQLFSILEDVTIGILGEGLLIPATIVSLNLRGMILATLGLVLGLVLGPLLLLVQRAPSIPPSSAQTPALDVFCVLKFPEVTYTVMRVLGGGGRAVLTSLN